MAGWALTQMGRFLVCVITGDVNSHSTLWHSYTNDHSGQLIADVISNSDHLTLTQTHTHQPKCQTPHYNKHLLQIPPRCLTHYTIGHRGQLTTHYHHTTYPSSPQSTYDMTTYYNKPDGISPTTRKPTDTIHGRHRVHSRSDHHTLQPTHCQHNVYKYHTDGIQAQHTKGQDA